MSERYSRLFTSPENLYATGSPVLIVAGALLKDNQTGKVLVQLKLQNIGTKLIKAVTVSIQPLDVVGNSLGNEVVYQYLDLNAKRNGEFGSKTPVILHDASTRSYSVSVQEVIFADNTVWQTSDEPWETLISPVTLERFLNDHELVKQYRIKFGADCKYKPTEQKDLWYCTCGELNQKKDTICHRCRKALTSQLSVDVTALKQDRDNRTAAEQKKAAEDRAAAETQAKKSKKIAIISAAVICAVIAFVVMLNTVIIPNSKYEEALVLMDSGRYSEAIVAFEVLGEYRDSNDKITECRMLIIDMKYNDAVTLIADGRYSEAISILQEIGSYKDSTKKISECNFAIQINAWKKLKAGDITTFGSYEQDGNELNGKEKIEWLVLEVSDGKALIISRYALDSIAYNTGNTDVTWGTCTLRKWLNNEFYNSTFSELEKTMIPTVTVSADKNPLYNTNPGVATQDKVFLLSIAEAEKYFNTDSARQCGPTTYAVANGVTVRSTGNCWCWLRSPGDKLTRAAGIDHDGDLHELGTTVNYEHAGVRPALWINIG